MPSSDWIDPRGFRVTLQDPNDGNYAQLVAKKLAHGWRPYDPETAAAHEAQALKVIAASTAVVGLPPEGAKRELVLGDVPEYVKNNSVTPHNLPSPDYRRLDRYKKDDEGPDAA